MAEHLPWIGRNYRRGINGQRIAIVGYCHYAPQREPDGDDMTIRVVKSVISGQRHRFLTPVEAYFQAKVSAEFWNSILYFNLVPKCLPAPSAAPKNSDNKKRTKLASRFHNIISKQQPDKVFVFTMKGRALCAEMEDEERDAMCPVSLDSLFPKFYSHTAGNFRNPARVYLLRHPQGAQSAHMQGAVQYIMSLPTKRSLASS